MYIFTWINSETIAIFGGKWVHINQMKISQVHLFRSIRFTLLAMIISSSILAQRFEIYESKVYPSDSTSDRDLYHLLELLTQDTLHLSFKDYTPRSDTTKIYSSCDEVDYIDKIKKWWWWTIDTVKAPVRMNYEWKVYHRNNHRITRIKGYVCDTDEDDDYIKDVLKRAKALAKASRKRIDTYFKNYQ